MGKKLTLGTAFKFLVIAIIITVVIMFFRSCNEMLEPYEFQENIQLIQLENPKPEQEVAILDTTLGEIRMMLFREKCPKTVDNFVTLANEGYYDGTFFFSSEAEVYAMAGSENKDGSGAKTTNDRRISNEYDDELWPLKGAVLSIGDRQGSSDSRFFFVWDAMKQQGYDKTSLIAERYPENVAEAFEKQGGVPALKGTTKAAGYTVFAQVYEGLDIVHDYTNVPVSGANSTPTENLRINSVKIMTYSESLEIPSENKTEEEEKNET